MIFREKLDAIVQKNNSLVCVGLDADFKKIPESVRTKKYPQFAFSKAIVDTTANEVCAFKPQSAYFEATGAKGLEELKMTCDYIRERHPGIPLILDAKRADIGPTNEAYAVFAFEYLGVDAITLHPYFGQEALKPFLDHKEKGCIILCRTSNPGAGEFQDLKTDGKPIYQQVAENVVKKWNTHGNCMLVVGATYPEELKQVRSIVGDMTILVPGIGAQGGDLEATMLVGLNSKKSGVIIHASRSIIFASSEKDFASVALREVKKLKENINSFR